MRCRPRLLYNEIPGESTPTTGDSPRQMPDTRQLHRLQEMDLGIEARQAEFAEVTAKLADESEITDERARLDKLESELASLATARRGLERALGELEEGLQKVEGRLYGGQVTNPKELEAAEEERRFTVARRGEHEDKLLDVMVDIEARDELRAGAQRTLQRLEAGRPGLVQELTNEQARLTAELADLNRRARWPCASARRDRRRAIRVTATDEGRDRRGGRRARHVSGLPTGAFDRPATAGPHQPEPRPVLELPPNPLPGIGRS